MTKRAIVYARVSTDEQAEKGFSLSAQIEAGRKYAEVHGLTVMQELIDDGISGARAFSERPAGSTAWELLRTGKAQALIVQNVDRLSRDVVDLLVTIRELLRVGVEVHCLDLGRVTSEYDIMLVIRGWQGSDERAKIRERSIRGKRQKAINGLVVCCGGAPYGYDYLRDEKGRVINFAVNEEQAAIVRLIYQWYTQGDGEVGPLSLFAIGERLSAAGITAPGKTRRKAAHIWDSSCISRILKSTTYKGEWRYRANSGADTLLVIVPAIVDPATWEAAQIQRERNQRKAKRNAKHDYLLSGIVRCGCGLAMAGMAPSTNAAGTKLYRYYYCHSSSMRYPSLEERTCFEKRINADLLETAVWDTISKIIRDPEDFEQKLREAQQQELNEQEPKRAELEAVQSLLTEAESEAAQLATALTKAKGVVEKALQDKITVLNERYTALVARRDDLENMLAQRRLTDEVIEAALRYAQDVGRGLDNPDNATKRHVLDLFNVRIKVEDGIPTLSCMPLPNPIELQMQTHRLETKQSCFSSLSRQSLKM